VIRWNLSASCTAKKYFCLKSLQIAVTLNEGVLLIFNAIKGWKIAGVTPGIEPTTLDLYCQLGTFDQGHPFVDEVGKNHQ